jgi:hypothetical protein
MGIGLTSGNDKNTDKLERAIVAWADNAWGKRPEKLGRDLYKAVLSVELLSYLALQDDEHVSDARVRELSEDDVCRRCISSSYVHLMRAAIGFKEIQRQRNMTTTNPEAKLTEAYHLVFDVKDNTELVPPGSEAAQQALYALTGIERLAQQLDITMPRRFDGDGRPTEATK